jgi:type IV pilus assembly protein PilW
MQAHLPRHRGERGFSLAELLIAVSIGLLVLAGLTTLFVRNTRAQGEIENANRQVENGRYALDVISNDLANAGYYGEFNPGGLAAPSALPDFCATALADVISGLALPVQGLDQSGATLSCIGEAVAAGTDVLVVRRTATCITGAAGCDAATAGVPYLQASLCQSELSQGAAQSYRLDTDTSKLDRRQLNCTPAGGGTLAPFRRYLTHIYFIASNNKAGDHIPTLKRAELDAGANGLTYTVVPLAEGIQNLQLEYGLDNGTADGIADAWSADPATAGACSAAACAVANWSSVVAVKLHLLAMNPTPSLGYKDAKTYDLGHDAAGAAITYTPPTNDAHKRHVFQTVVTLPNPSGRRTPP